ncbi:hypothetical protein ACWD3J_48970 [Streptomyces sp. NPDC002755]|uniref:hypothetical protein n=1 Tax=Streptomyces sp. NPDC002884 TaxID=3154544 RepID=UPI00332BFBD8
MGPVWIRLPLIATRDGVDEAVAQARSHPEGATRYAAPHIAELLAGAGRTEEAVAVLAQHSSSNRHDLAGYLIDLGRVGGFGDMAELSVISFSVQADCLPLGLGRQPNRQRIFE